jgi:2-C-methyl-D-erythritol 4-phosphate cytidylyltransferase
MRSFKAQNKMAKRYGLIAAAGYGNRMGNKLPKQYLPVSGKPMVSYSVARLCSSARIDGVYIVLSPEDKVWSTCDWSAYANKLKPLPCGGETRAQSVLNGLQAMEKELNPDDWVLVHDAARPCLTSHYLEKLIDEVGDDEVGGLLAIPVSDTLKRADHKGYVIRTEHRANLWQAQTPQMFRFELLHNALSAMSGNQPTDEAQAIETIGLQPKLVECDSFNLKVTYPQDIELAEMILARKEAA